MTTNTLAATGRHACMAWSLTSAWTLKGGVAKGFQSPTIAQINPNIGLPQRGGAQTWGNPDLKPEESLNREIGAYYDAGRCLPRQCHHF